MNKNNLPITTIKDLFYSDKFNYKELYQNIPDEFCIFIKSSNKYVFNYQFGLFTIDNDFFNKMKPHYENVEIYKEKYAKFVNIAILESVFINLCCFNRFKDYDNTFDQHEYHFITRNGYGINDEENDYCKQETAINNDILYDQNILNRRMFGKNRIARKFVFNKWNDESIWIIGDYDVKENQKLFTLTDRLIHFGHAKRVDPNKDLVSSSRKPQNYMPHRRSLGLIIVLVLLFCALCYKFDILFT